MRQNQKRTRNRPAICKAAAGAAGLIGSLALTGTVSGTVYTYTPTSSNSDLWATGSDWSATPLSGSSTELTFVDTTGATALGPLINTNTDNIPGNFSLNILDLGGMGNGMSGNPAAITIAASAGDSLDFVSNGNSTPIVNLDANNGAGQSTVSYAISVPIVLGNNTTYQGNGNASFTFSGPISGSGGLTLVSSGGGTTLTLSGANSYTGNTAVTSGTLSLLGSLSATGTLVGAGGTFSYGNTTSGVSQTVNGLVLSADASTATNASVNNAGLILGAISRTVGATVNFGNSTAGPVGSIFTTTGNNATGSGIIGGFATYGGITWAVGSHNGTSTAITGLASYTSITSTLHNSSNVDMTSSGNITTTRTINSLRFNNAGTITLTQSGGTTLTIASGGILVTSAAGSTSPAAVITGGSLTSAIGDLILLNYDTSANLKIGSVITNDGGTATGVTYAGPGLVALNNPTNTYTGNTTFDVGSVLVFGDNNLGADPTTPTIDLIFNGGELMNAANAGTYAINGNRAVYLGINGGYLRAENPSGNAGQATLLINGNITGPGGLGIVYDYGNVELAGSNNTYAGNTTIGVAGNSVSYLPNGNTSDLQLGATNALPYGAAAGNVVINQGATLDLNGFSANMNGLWSGNQTSSSTAIVNDSAAASATLTIGNGNATSSYFGQFENTSTGNLSLSLIGAGGGLLNGNINIGGSLSVSGAGQWTLAGTDVAGKTVVDGTLFAAANSSLQASGVIVGNATNANGYLTVGDANAGAELDLLSGNITVGNNGNGTLTLQNSSALEIDNLNAATVGLTVAANSGSTGTVTLTGNSALDLAGNVTVGNPGSSTAKGTISLTNGGTLSDDNFPLAISSGGNVTLNGGSLDVASITNNGTFAYLSGSLTLGSSNLSIGAGGLLGSSLNLTNGDAITVSGNTSIPSGGSLTINGGDFTTGSLLVNPGGTLAFTSGSLDLTNSDLNVSSAGLLGSAVNIGANQSISVSGNTTVAAGGSLTLNGGALDTNTLVNAGAFTLSSGYFTVESNLLIDSATGTFPSVTVPANSYLGVGGTLTVGESATGSITTSAGASIYAGKLSLGDGNGSTGTITLNGTQAAVNDLTIVGNYGDATLNLLTGSSLTTNNLFIAQQPESTSVLQISGNSSLVASGFTAVGGTFDGVAFDQGGKGAVSIASGGSLETIGLYVSSGSTVTVNGSLILDGPSRIYSGGTIGGGGTISASFPGSSLTLNSGGTITGGGAGAGPAKLTSSSQTWNGGATYLCNIASAAGSPGAACDDLSLSSLALVNASPSIPFIVQLVSLGNNTQGRAVVGFNPGQSYSWTIAQINVGGSGNGTGAAFTINGSTPAAGVLTGLASSDFALETASFASENDVPANGIFQLNLVSINSQESDLVLDYYVSTPEPTTGALVLCAAPLLLRRRRYFVRRTSQRPVASR